MIVLNGFSDYVMDLEKNEVFTHKNGECEKLEPCKDTKKKCWYLYKNGQRFRKTLYMLLLENIDKIEKHCLEKTGKYLTNKK